MPAELHCHSFYSIDGWISPEEIAEQASDAGVTTLSLTDHNCIEGLGRCRTRAQALGMRFINGIEFDVKWQDGDYHVLAFGFDPENERLKELLACNWRCYELNFARWAPVIEQRYGVGLDELRTALPARYGDRPNPVPNKWFARSYLLERGIFADHAEALREMASVGTEAEGHLPADIIWPFAHLDEVVDAVHGAGGITLLAHVGGARHGDLEGQLRLIHEMMDAGVDGFELYHRANTVQEHFHELESAAKRLGCPVSGGSDAHSHPRHARSSIGRVEVPDWVVETIDAKIAQRRRGRTLL